MNSRSSSARSIHFNKVDARWLERVAKGFANHRRIRVLQLLIAEPELSLSDICERLNMSRTAGSEHVRKLTIAGLVVKRKQNTNVHHKVTDRGLLIFKFLKTIK